MSLDASTTHPPGVDPAVGDAFDEVESPPRGALVLAGVDVAFALLLPIVGVYGHYGLDDDGYHRSGLDAYGRPGQLLTALLWLADIAFLFWPAVLIASVVSLVGVRVRSAPQIFRVLLAATGLLVLVVAAGWLWYAVTQAQGV